MLCPEVWNFEPPKCYLSHDFCDSKNVLQSTKSLYFNHHVTIVLPNTIRPPVDVINAALEDSQFYRVNDVSAFELLDKDFFNFIKNGELTAVSLNEFPEQNSFTITPSGTLIMSFNKNTFLELGVDSNVVLHPKGDSLKKFFMVLDLNSDLKDSVKKCEQVYSKLSKCAVKFDMILAWEPQDSSICPSTVAYYFSKRGYLVKTCEILFKQKLQYNVEVPVYDEQCDPYELSEWLGAFCMECDMSESHISSMRPPENSELFGQVMTLNFSGLLTQSRIKKIISEISKYIQENSPLTWTSITIHNFQNCITDVKNKCLLTCDGDKHCTIFFRNNHPSLVCNFQQKIS